MSIKLTSAETGRNKSSVAAAVGTGNKISIAPLSATYIKNTPNGWSNVSVGAIDTTNATLIGAAAAVQITNIFVTDSSFNNLDDTAISTSGGYLKIIGTGFQSGATVFIQGVAAASVSFFDSTQLRVTTPVLSSGTLQVYVVNPDNSVAIRISGIVASGVPDWVTVSPLPDQLANSAFSIQLSATSDSTVAYSLQNGSSLPSGVSLSSSGLLSGTVEGLTSDTSYSFTIVATDLELQDTAKLFSVTLSVGDVYFKYSSLLLKTESNIWINDSSSNRFYPYVGNDTKPSAFSPFNNRWSTSFDGTGDYLTVSSNTAFTFSGNFTIECWINPTALSTLTSLWGMDTGASTYFALNASNTSILAYFNTASGAPLFTATPVSSIRFNTWSHIALVRNESTVTAYVNGQAASGTGTSSATVGSSTNTFRIGGITGGYSGQISNLRVVNGTALYTGNFTPPNTALTAVANTVLLTCLDNRFIDESTANSGVGFTVTKVADAQIKSSGPFDDSDITTGSAYFDGTGDYLDYNGESQMAFGTSDFTIEFFAYINVLGTFMNFYDSRPTSTNGAYPTIYKHTDNTLRYYANTGERITGPVLTTNTWYHIVVSRVSGVTRMFVDGTQIASTYTDSTTYLNGTSRPRIGANGVDGSSSVNGYISNLRLLKGTGVTSVTVPTQPLSNVANTQLLTLQYRKGETNKRFIDESGNKYPILNFNNVTQGSFSPFSADEGYWSQNFATNFHRTYLTMSTNIIDVGTTSTFTIEGWIYLPAGAPLTWATMACTTDFSLNSSWIAGVDVNRRIEFYWFIGSAFRCTGTTILESNKWHFLQFRANNGALSLGVNGVQETVTGTTSLGNPGDNTFLSFGAERTYNNPCYLYDVRISNVVRSFTLPATPMTSDSNTRMLTLRKRINVNESNLANALISSAVSYPMTPFGQRSTVTSYTPSIHGGSMYFDGSLDYLTGPSSFISTSTNTFTIDGWLYPTSFNYNGAQCYFFGDLQPAGTTLTLSVRLYTDGKIALHWTDPTARQAISTNSLRLNHWNYFAIVVNNNAISIYLNSTTPETLTGTTTLTNRNATSSFGVGQFNNQYFYMGYIGPIRWTNGVARTISSIPTTAFTSDANTTILLNSNNPGIYDATGQQVLETSGNTYTANTISKYSGSSMYFDGTGDNLHANVLSSNTSVNVLGGDFTIEAWVYASNTTNRSIITLGSETTSRYTVSVINGVLTTRVFGSADISHTGNSITTNNWHHIAVCRSGSTIRGFVDGVVSATTATNSSVLGNGPIRIGSNSTGAANNWFGYIEDLRITRFARYANTFTVPGYALPTK
jgi:hypothetical protein